MSLELVLLVPDHPDDEPEALLVGAAPADALSEFLAGVAAEPRLVEVEHLSAAGAVLVQATPASAVAHDPVGIPLVRVRPGMCAAKTGFFDRALPEDAVRELTAHLVGGG
ncbi:hypothetical protein [Umezawaea sp.]|uniref:hypothetical protein n=1 Tax=Umezawaea sp. TaxID=1955258 RepID=UPI002ED3E887